MKLQLASGFSVLLMFSGAAAAQQTLTFTNTDTNPGTPVEPQVITLLGGSTVSIAPNGNLTASCVLGTSPSTLCQGTGSGGGTGVPTVSLSTSLTPPGTGPYDPGTSFTITPTVTNALVCVRSVNVTPATSTSTNWPAVLGAPPFNPQVVNVLAPNSTYAFTMKCYNDSGSTTFTLPNITTNDGPPPTSCSSFTPPLPAGWLRLSSPQSMPQVPLLSILGQNWNNFPNGGGRGIIATANGRYISLAITAPTDVEAWNQATPTKAIFWDQSQSAGPATLTKVLVTISECAGDFRLPPAGPAPATDPTYARGCRSYRALTAGGTLSPRDSVPYQITTTNEVSTETTCKLAPGKSYHINFIRADVRDNVIGTPSEEVGLCEQPNQTSCGVDMNVE